MSDVVRGARVGAAVTWMGGATCTAGAVGWTSAAARDVSPVAPRSHAERRKPASTRPSTLSEVPIPDRPSARLSPFLLTAPSLWDVLGGRHRAKVTARGGRKVLEALPYPNAKGLRPQRALEHEGNEKRSRLRSLLAPNVHYGEGHPAKPLVLRLPVRPGVRRSGRSSSADLLQSARVWLDDAVDGEA